MTARRRLHVLLGSAGCFVLACLAASSPAPAETPALVQEVLSIRIPVRDLERAARFYRDVLGFRPLEGETAGSTVSPPEARATQGTLRLRLGAESVELVQARGPDARPMPPDSRANDLWFQHLAIVVRDMSEAYRHLRRHKVEHASAGPQRLPDWNAAAAGIEAFYFRDPDGHFLEIIHFPPGKGQPKWQEPSETLFLGIDHTAIVVADTEASLRFYRDTLGLQVAGASENYGPAQERLNGLFGARLRITTLRAASGPGIELLEYLFPRGGRAYPGDTRAEDAWNWQIVCGSRVVPAAARLGLIEAAASSAAGSQESNRLQSSPAVLVRDPDGHALRIVER
jgi:catechol 2,3-dioxygenase-like lactoylglutathione lyase family enzyme